MSCSHQMIHRGQWTPHLSQCAVRQVVAGPMPMGLRGFACESSGYPKASDDLEWPQTVA
jgi:hypothetical protein